MQAETPNINNVFNRSRRLQIPHFQRSYVWEEEQWERFLDDLKNISIIQKPYFLGSIILKNIEAPIMDGVGGNSFYNRWTTKTNNYCIIF